MPWIKVRTDLLTDPRVMRMARALGVTQQHVVGCLVAVWSLADAHAVSRFCPGVTGTREGHLAHYSAANIDAAARQDGIADLMSTVGWLTIYPDGIGFPEWDIHNGNSAKTRACEQKKKAKQRRVSPKMSPKVSRLCPDGAGTEIGTREDKSIKEDPLTPTGGIPSSSAAPVGPAEFLAAWNAVKAFVGCRGLAGKRLRALQARARSKDWAESWREALARAAKSPFCTGANDRGWRATIDWFLRPDTLAKILEGHYDDRKPAGPAVQPIAPANPVMNPEVARLRLATEAARRATAQQKRPAEAPEGQDATNGPSGPPDALAG